MSALTGFSSVWWFLRLFLELFVYLQEMLKYSRGREGADDLQEALTSIVGILKAVNDSMHLIAITGYEVQRQLPFQNLLLGIK